MVPRNIVKSTAGNGTIADGSAIEDLIENGEEAAGLVDGDLEIIAAEGLQGGSEALLLSGDALSGGEDINRSTIEERVVNGEEDAGFINGDTPISRRLPGADDHLVEVMQAAISNLGADTAEGFLEGSAEGFLEGQDISTKEEFVQKFPLTAAAMDAWSEKATNGNPSLRVISRIHGFRRGGIAHSAEATDHLMLGLTASQVEAILGEPQLISEIV